MIDLTLNKILLLHWVVVWQLTYNGSAQEDSATCWVCVQNYFHSKWQHGPCYHFVTRL